jgi:hypothetical protein
MDVFMLMRRILALALVCALVPAQALGFDEDIIKNRPAFSLGDQPAVAPAQCHEIRKMSEGVPQIDGRIDFSSEGILTLVKGDGALWYLVMCSDVRIMCVTYESNDMKVGERVIFKGGYSRLDDDHALLDPCLANRP